MLVEPSRVADAIAAVAATEIMPYFEKLRREDVSEKRPGDLVTVADVAAERRLSAMLLDLLPGSAVVGEEAASAHPGVLEALAGSDPVWIVDPIDGTANFAAGTPVFAVMVALARHGETLAGWIYDPVRRRLATAVIGEGAWCDGVRLAASAAPPPSSPRLGNRQVARRVGSRSALVEASFDYRCAAHEYLALASGQAQYAYYNRLHPWDHAAGVLLHREAGGFGALIDGTPYRPQAAASGLLLAPDSASWHELQAAIAAPATA